MAAVEFGSPMRQIDHLLRDGEHVLLVTREHGMVLLRPFLRAAVIVGASSTVAVVLSGRRWMWPLPALVAVLAGLVAARAIVRLMVRVGSWHSRRLVVTDRKVIYVRGALRRRVSALSLAGIDDVEVTRRWRLLGFSCGGLVVSAGGRRGTLFALRRLPHPDRILSLLASLGEGRGDALAGPADDAGGADPARLPVARPAARSLAHR